MVSWAAFTRMTRLGRCVIRPDGSGLLLGKLFNATEHLKPNTVYELCAFNGEIVFRELGESALPREGEYPCWNSSVSAIVEDGRHVRIKDEGYK